MESATTEERVDWNESVPRQGETSKTPNTEPREGRLMQVMNFLLREKVGSELIFTSEHIAQAAHELGITHVQDIYRALSRLEKKGFIARQNRGRGKGYLITFRNTGKPGPVPRSGKRQRNFSPNTLLRGKKLQKLLSFLRQEVSKGRFVFTSKHAAGIGKMLGSRDKDVYGMLVKLENKGCITRRHLGCSKGILITLPDAQMQCANAQNESSGSVADLLKELAAEIARDEMALNSKKGFYTELKARSEGRSS